LPPGSLGSYGILSGPPFTENVRWRERAYSCPGRLNGRGHRCGKSRLLACRLACPGFEEPSGVSQLVRQACEGLQLLGGLGEGHGSAGRVQPVIRQPQGHGVVWAILVRVQVLDLVGERVEPALPRAVVLLEELGPSAQAPEVVGSDAVVER